MIKFDKKEGLGFRNAKKRILQNRSLQSSPEKQRNEGRQSQIRKLEAGKQTDHGELTAGEMAEDSKDKSQIIYSVG